MSYTKGDWKVRGNKIFIDDTYKSIADVHVVKNYKDVTFEPIEDIEANANAKLISAAPDLLEALLIVIETVGWKKDYTGGLFDKVVRSAIKKAGVELP